MLIFLNKSIIINIYLYIYIYLCIYLDILRKKLIIIKYLTIHCKTFWEISRNFIVYVKKFNCVLFDTTWFKTGFKYECCYKIKKIILQVDFLFSRDL